MPSNGKVKKRNSQGAAKAAKAVEKSELDDFGLPVTKLAPPAPAEKEADTEANGSTPETTQAKGKETEGQISDEGTAKTTSGLSIKTANGPLSPRECDNSDDDDFKDAISTPQPDVQEFESSAKKPVSENAPSEEKVKSSTKQPEPNDAPLKETVEVSTKQPEPKDIPLKDIIEPASPQKEIPAPDAQAATQSQVPKVTKPKHERGQSSTNGISEWSHQQMAPQKEQEQEEKEEDEWQTMPAFAPFDMYDDDNRLIAKEHVESDDDGDAGLGGAGKGYTRLQLDEDAQSATSMDENTKYLFKEVNGTSAAGPDDEEQRDAVSQMQATKDLLTEGQRIAYVGMTRLALSSMIKVAEQLENKSRGTKKVTAQATEAMQMWSQKMMVRLYAHMDISTAEQVMIEQLAEHGVEPGDLTPTLMQNSRVKNPMAENDVSTPSNSSSRPGSGASNHKSNRDSISSRIYDDEEAAAPPPAYVEHEGDDLPEVRTPSQLPNTKNIDIDLRWTVLCDLFLTLIADSVYDARSRVLLEKVGEHMDVPWIEICRFEKRVTDALEMQQAAEKENWNEDEHKENRRKMALKKRYMMMGLATVGGSLVIGLSAGLLAPVIGAGLAAGFTTIGVAGTSGFLAGAGGAAIITSGAAASGGVIAVRAANRRTGAVKTFEYRPLHNNKRVNLIVTVSGWMTGKVDDVRLPYSTVDPIMGDIYSVLWEPEMLTSMGDTINILATEALTQGLQQVLGSTILIGLMAALQLPVVLTKLAYLIDNPWTVSLDRANAAGLILADSLIDRNLGTRPITFVGYSLGSRVIFSCLRELARKGAYGLVQNVFLFGSPIVAKRDEYLKARTVVAGRFVNGFAKNDWILGYLFRLTSGGISRVAGLAPIEEVPGLENIDVTEFVPGHMSYRTAMPRLLREVGWAVESDEFSEIEDPDPDNHQVRQRELINEIEEARKEFEKQEAASKGKFGWLGRKKKNVIEKKEWETYQESKGVEDDGGAGGSRTEDPQGNNHGVLFDIDAIRAELASEHMEVKELKSTLPPMRLDLSKAADSPRSNLRETKSYDASALMAKPALSSPQPARSPSARDDYDYDEGNNDDIQMSFDTGYHSPAPSYSHSHRRQPSTSPAPHSRYTPSPIADPPERAVNIQRPDLKSSNTLPVSLGAGAGAGLGAGLGMGIGAVVEHNAWADDDDEFQEKEMEMTFA